MGSGHGVWGLGLGRKSKHMGSKKHREQSPESDISKALSPRDWPAESASHED